MLWISTVNNWKLGLVRQVHCFDMAFDLNMTFKTMSTHSFKQFQREQRVHKIHLLQAEL